MASQHFSEQQMYDQFSNDEVSATTELVNEHNWFSQLSFRPAVQFLAEDNAFSWPYGVTSAEIMQFFSSASLQKMWKAISEDQRKSIY